MPPLTSATVPLLRKKESGAMAQAAAALASCSSRVAGAGVCPSVAMGGRTNGTREAGIIVDPKPPGDRPGPSRLRTGFTAMRGMRLTVASSRHAMVAMRERELFGGTLGLCERSKRRPVQRTIGRRRCDEAIASAVRQGETGCLA